jgi:hypothetical protein
LAFDFPQQAASFFSVMRPDKIINWIAGFGLTFSMAATVGAAEKVKFGAQNSNPQITTQPLPAGATALPELKPQKDNVNAFVPEISQGASGPTIIQTKEVDDDQRNWIFRDTQSAKGIQRALGVEVYEPETGTQSGTSAPTSTIRNYFDRQNAAEAGAFSPDGASELEKLGLKALDFGPDKGIFGSADGSTLRPVSGIGQTGFQNTLQSANPSVRSYYRELYKNQIAPIQPVVPALDSVMRAEKDTRSRTKQLLDQAALIESMTPKGPVSVFQTQPSGGEPIVNQRRNRELDKPLIQRRGGKTVIPSRRF